MSDLPVVFWISYVALWVLLLVIAVLLLLLYRHFGLMTLGTVEGVQRDGLGVGERAKPLTLTRIGGPEGQWSPSTSSSHLVFFASPDCEPCAEVIPYVARVSDSVGEPLEVTAVVAGPPASAQQVVETFHPPFECLSEDGSGAFEDYKVRVTPFAFVIGSDGRVRSKGLCSDAFRLREILSAAGLDQRAKVLDASIPRPQDGARTIEVRGVSG